MAAALDLFSWQPMIGERIRELREKAKLSQTDVADRIGRSQETVSRYERTSNIPDDVLDEILAAIGATHDDVRDALKDTPSRRQRLRLERRGDSAQSNRPYAYTLADKYRWVQLVQSDPSLSSMARRVLEAIPKCIELDNSSPEAGLDFDAIVKLSADITSAEDVAAVWPEVLSCGYVERRYAPAKWIVALKFPERGDSGE